MKNDKIKEILEYIGKAKLDEYSKTHIWAVNEKDEIEHLADIRGWGAIQNMFINKDRAAEFQDSIGQFIVDAINEKIEKHLSESKEEKPTVISGSFLIEKRQKYIDAEIKHFRGTREKSKSIRAKISVIDEILNDKGLNDR